MKHAPKHKKATGKKLVLIKLFSLIILIVILFIIVFFAKVYFNAKKHAPNYEKKVSNEVNNSVEKPDEEENVVPVKTDEVVDTSSMPNDMEGYGVVGRLVIDKIGVDLNILERYDETSLNLSVVKFWGANVNEVGNCSLLGHNYERLLKRLRELEIGDTFYLINKENGTKVTYQIYDKYSCLPTQTECLYPPAEQVREVTLITCDPGGATRLICKAKEI